jgi:probable HAF family extracellular repeat protein
MRRLSFSVFLASVICVCGALPAMAQAPIVTRYYVYDVGPIVGELSPFRLNQNGAMIWNSNGHAFVYQSCQSHDIGSLGGQTFARAINSNGTVVGKSQQPGGRWRAFSYANGVMHDLGGSTNANIWEEATGANFWGDTVGVESVLGTLAPTGVRYQDGVATPFARFLVQPPFGWATPRAVDINDSRDVLGSIQTSIGGVPGNIAVLSTNFGYLWTKVLGVPGNDTFTFPFAMNRYGHVAGIAGNGYTRALISRNPALPATDLGSIGAPNPQLLSGATGINNYDWVVGWAEATSGGGPRAFLHDGTQMIDLNTMLWNPGGWLLREALAVNDAGQIVGEGLLNNQYHAFFLQPMKRLPLFDPCGRIVVGGVLGTANVGSLQFTTR